MPENEAGMEWAEPMVLDAQEIAIDYLRREGRSFSPSRMTATHGDLRLIVDALLDYARLVDEWRERAELTAQEAGSLAYYADRYRGIAGKIAAAIGYNRDATLRRCMKRREREEKDNDVGEDALVLATLGHGRPRVTTDAPMDDQEGGDNDGKL